MVCRHRRFLFVVALLSHLCRDSTATSDIYSIKEGSDFPFECTANADIFFTYPTNRTHASDTVFSYTSPIEISKNQYENGTYRYKFYRSNSVFGDTGWYGCTYHPILTTERNLSDTTIEWFYLYVEARTVRFVEQAKSHILVATVGENIVIPCRPTSPKAEVKLRKHDENGNDEVVPPHTFDATFGFTLYKVDKPQGGLYVCTIDPDQEVSYKVVVTDLLENKIPEPRIINSSGLLFLSKGESLYLKCAIIIPKNEDYRVFWIPTQQSDRVTTWSDVRPIENTIVERLALLKVTNVTYNDEGIYECRVKEGIYEKNSRTYVQVHESFYPFMNLKARDSNRYYTRHEGDEVEWIVDVKAYPLPELKWFHTNIDEVTKSLLPHGKSRFLIDNACCKSKLRINRLNLNDMGTYSIEVSNQYKKETLNFTLDVIAWPKVYMSKPISNYFHNQVTNVECHVKAFPKPNIVWSYQKCPNYPSCDNGTLEYLSNSRESGTVTHLLSTVSATLDMFGGLTCSACNVVGCRNVTEYVTFFDKWDFGVMLTKDTAAEGDDWELTCAASVQYYLDVFDWSNESGPIVQSDKISISRGRTQSTYRSILKIRKVKIEDSQEYICTGKSRGNWIRTAGYRLEVKAARAPIIIDTNLLKNEMIIDVTTPGRKMIDFHCFADGVPKPSISWFKDGIELVVSNALYKFSNNSQKLELEYPLEVDSGEYMCRAENRIGKVEVFQQITIRGFGIASMRSPVGLIILIVVLAVVVLILVIYFAKIDRREKRIRKQLMEAGPVHLQRGADKSLNRNLYVDDPTGLVHHS
ncbi:vascular endothelial growth factor receptor 1 [Megalopta genalis]|uniref:vascular endothelial growth factor receptor 1 n=1 Tax=Megalopta genalis TaxID=115081 RepID=UPI003FD11225